MKKPILPKLPLPGLRAFVSLWLQGKPSEPQIFADFRRWITQVGADSAAPSRALPTANCQLPTSSHSRFEPSRQDNHSAFRIPHSAFQKTEASVLLITLGFILLITVITVAFLVRSRSSLQTSQSYSREMIAKEVGEIGIDALAAQFQKEIRDAAAASTNLYLPDRTGLVEQNPRVSSLVRQTSSPGGVSTSTAAKNGWNFGNARWKTPALLTDAQYNAQAAAALPQWIYVYGQPTTASGTARDVVGRYAAMVYDLGGLIDINEAGVPATIPKGDKGSVAFADLSVLPNGANLKIAEWRDPSGSTVDYYGNSTVTDPKQAGRIESPTAKLKSGQNQFFSRMELVEAAKAGKGAFSGNATDTLPYLRTRSVAGNRISVDDPLKDTTTTPNVWRGGLFADGTSTPIKLSDSRLAASADTKFTIDRIDGTQETYTIQKGQPLVQNRFPLARLRWLADRQPDGTPNHPAEIKKYFGLAWNSADKNFIYTSPDASGTTPAAAIKTLTALVDQINKNLVTPREPDFFEWLKATIDPNSIGQTGGSTDREYPDPATGVLTGTMKVGWEYSKDLHIVRIGANIIDQSDPDSIPTGIRSQFTGVSPAPFDSFGQENLPGLNEAVVSAYRPDAAHLNGYLQFELWNPYREAAIGGRVLKGYDGQPIKAVRVGTTGGRMIMEPFVYIPGAQRYPKAPNGTGLESGNSAWGCYLNISDFSMEGLPFLANNNALKASDYNPSSLANQFISIPISNTNFFTEPRIASSSGPDSSNPAKSGSGPNLIGKGTQLYIGSSPAHGVNAIQLCSLNCPNVAFTGIPLSCTSNSSKDGIYAFGANASTSGGGAGVSATKSPSGPKCYNSVKLHSYTGVVNGVATSPISMQIEVEDHLGNRFPVNRYQNLALGVNMPNNLSEGRINGIISGLPATQQESLWTADSSKTSYFSNWAQVSIHKGYPMTDPRTERFGLSDQNEATPGQGIYPQPNLTWVDGSGQSPNMPCGTIVSVGQQMSNNGIWDSQASAAQTKTFTITSLDTGGKVTTSKFNLAAPMDWQLFDVNVSESVPAYLARNQWMDNTNGGVANPYGSCSYGTSYAGHAYKDYDGVPRPGDARWVGWGAHPALPLTGGSSDADIIAARPTILDRPFRNVAELGCVFRDVPWKSLDLFSADSPDRRLLDVFSIEDRATVTGKINPNLASPETLKAILHGTSLDPSTSLNPETVSQADADAVAGKLAGLSASTPSDLVTGGETLAKFLISTKAAVPQDAQPVISGNSTYAGTGTPPSKIPTIFSFKTKTENFLRALSSTTDTRSWQLMFDVVAQSGRIAPSSTSLQDFVVEGQKRFFVYLTLDRITGEIIDKYVEPVYE